MQRECHGSSPRERWSCLTTLYWHGALDSRRGTPVFLLCFGAAERSASGAAGSGSEVRADAGSRRLHALVRWRFALPRACAILVEFFDHVRTIFELLGD